MGETLLNCRTRSVITGQKLICRWSQAEFLMGQYRVQYKVASLKTQMMGLHVPSPSWYMTTKAGGKVDTPAL